MSRLQIILNCISIGLACLSICIAISAFVVSYWNFRLSRFPHVRPRFKTYGRDQGKGFEKHFEVEVHSWGLPIYDMKVMLEGDYRSPIPPHLPLLQFPMTPLGTSINPMNPGQVAKFKISRSEVQEIDHTTKMNRKLGLSDLPWDRVAVCIYRCGDIPIKTFKRRQFDLGFYDFDTLIRNPEVNIRGWQRIKMRGRQEIRRIWKRFGKTTGE